ncbi:MAG: hypothetical protein ACC645_08185, partial [Pirellulales bacterium]
MSLATDRPSPAVLPEVDRLRDRLQDVIFFVSRLLAHVSEDLADRLKLDAAQSPLAAFPPGYLEKPGTRPKRKPLPDDQRSPSLRESVQADLTAFWEAMEGAYAALDSLPADVVSDLQFVAGGNWQLLVRRVLDE